MFYKKTNITPNNHIKLEDINMKNQTDTQASNFLNTG